MMKHYRPYMLLRSFFDNKRSYPFLSDSLNKRTTKLTEELETFLQDQKEDLLKIIFEESVKDEICDFFEGKVGDGFTDEQLKSYYKEAEDRYKSNIPPGFKDSEKNGNSKYGDYIIWCEIMSKASNDNKDILFITDDVKCDWYIEINGKRIGPHPSLLNEFRQKTNHEIYMYSLDSFLNHAKERKIKVKGKTIEEVKDRKSGVIWDYAALDAMKNMSYAVFYKSMLQALGTYYHIPESQLRNMELFYRLKQQMDSYNEFQKGIATVKDSMRGWESVLEKYSQQFKALDGKKEEDNKDILFITDDVKCDWYIEINGKRIGPHPSLLNEFRQKTNHEIYMYSLDSFLNYAKERKIKVKGKTIEEVKERKSGVVWDYATWEAMRNMSNAVLYKSILQTLDTYHQLTEPQKRGLEYFSKLQQQMESYNEFQKRIATIKDSIRGWEDFAETYRSQQFKGIDNKKEENKEE